MQVTEFLSSCKFQPWWGRQANSPIRGGTYTTCCWKAARAVGKTGLGKGTFHPVMRAGPTDKCLSSKDLEKNQFPLRPPGYHRATWEKKKNLIMGVTGRHRTSRFDFSPCPSRDLHSSILVPVLTHTRAGQEPRGAFVPWVPPRGPLGFHGVFILSAISLEARHLC